MQWYEALRRRARGRRRRRSRPWRERESGSGVQVRAGVSSDEFEEEIPAPDRMEQLLPVVAGPDSRHRLSQGRIVQHLSDSSFHAMIVDAGVLALAGV